MSYPIGLLDINEDVLKLVMSYLDLKDMAKVEMVCKDFKKAAAPNWSRFAERLLVNLPGDLGPDLSSRDRLLHFFGNPLRALMNPQPAHALPMEETPTRFELDVNRVFFCRLSLSCEHNGRLVSGFGQGLGQLAPPVDALDQDIDDRHGVGRVFHIVFPKSKILGWKDETALHAVLDLSIVSVDIATGHLQLVSESVRGGQRVSMPGSLPGVRFITLEPSRRFENVIEKTQFRFARELQDDDAVFKVRYCIFYRSIVAGPHPLAPPIAPGPQPPLAPEG